MCTVHASSTNLPPGIFLTSTFIFIFYAGYKRSNPRIFSRVLLPAIVSGIMWAIAQAALSYSPSTHLSTRPQLNSQLALSWLSSWL